MGKKNQLSIDEGVERAAYSFPTGGKIGGVIFLMVNLTI